MASWQEWQVEMSLAFLSVSEVKVIITISSDPSLMSSENRHMAKNTFHHHLHSSSSSSFSANRNIYTNI